MKQTKTKQKNQQNVFFLKNANKNDLLLDQSKKKKEKEREDSNK
jgi:hypothetical protein